MSKTDKKEVARSTYRMPCELDEEMDRAARRAGLSKNDWLINAVRTRLSAEADRQLDHGHMARHTQQLAAQAARLGLLAETQLVMSQMIFCLLPEYDQTQQARLSKVGKSRYAFLLDQVVAGMSQGKRLFLDELERKIFESQDWESHKDKEKK